MNIYINNHKTASIKKAQKRPPSINSIKSKNPTHTNKNHFFSNIHSLITFFENKTFQKIPVTFTSFYYKNSLSIYENQPQNTPNKKQQHSFTWWQKKFKTKQRHPTTSHWNRFRYSKIRRHSIHVSIPHSQYVNKNIIIGFKNVIKIVIIYLK